MKNNYDCLIDEYKIEQEIVENSNSNYFHKNLFDYFKKQQIDMLINPFQINKSKVIFFNNKYLVEDSQHFT